jgi:23S rRNA pseudouridine955/2504/2580 synthase
VHTRHAGHAILGDRKYGEKAANQWASERGLDRLFLHASSLAFRLASGERIELQAPLDPTLDAFLAVIRQSSEIDGPR